MSTQNKILIDGNAYKQPDTFDFSFATTDSETTARPISGKLKGAPLYVVESYAYKVTNLTAATCSNILKKITRRPSKPDFELTYFSPFYGEWRTDTFYVAQGEISVNTLKVGEERMQEISCNMIGVNPLDG